jgi:hypothetical protein
MAAVRAEPVVMLVPRLMLMLMLMPRTIIRMT